MLRPRREPIAVGDQVFVEEGGEEIGAVREIRADRGEILVRIENGGDHWIPTDAVHDHHDEKVILAVDRLGRDVREAIARAHAGEVPGL